MTAIASLSALGLAWWLYRRVTIRDAQPLGRLRDFKFSDELVWVVVIGAALGDQPDAWERGTVEAARGPLGSAAHAVSGHRSGRGGGQRQQAGDQERMRRGQRYVFCVVSSSVIRLKN